MISKQQLGHRGCDKFVWVLAIALLGIILFLHPLKITSKSIQAPNTNSVIFPDTTLANVTQWSATEIGAQVPDGTTDGDVVVQTATGTSNGSAFAPGSSATPDETGVSDSWVYSFSGQLAANTVWSANILLTGDVVVPAGITLTIEPGITVLMTANSDNQGAGLWTDKVEIVVHGTLVAEATYDNPIYFTSDTITKAVSDWGAILLRKDSNTYISGCHISYAERGVYLRSTLEGGGQLTATIRNSTFVYNNMGISARSRPDGGTLIVEPTIVNNTIKYNITGIDTTTGTGIGTARNYSVIQNNVVEENAIGINVLGYSWWQGSTESDPQIVNNTIRNNVEAGISIKASGSGDSSGSNTQASPIVTHNLLENNGHNITLALEPNGSDGVQTLTPIVQYNTIRDATYGIIITDTQSYDTLNPTISHNVFYGFDGATSYAVNNTTGRSITANENYWGDDSTAWDAGPTAGDDITGTVVTNYLDTSVPPLLTRLAPGVAQSGNNVTLYGANFGGTMLPGELETLELTAEDEVLPADGIATTAISATLRDIYRLPVTDGTPVTFATTLGTLAPPVGTTLNGVATATLTTGLTPGSVTLTATTGAISDTLIVTFTQSLPHTVSVQSASPTLPADGQSTTVLSATVSDANGQPVSNGTPVTFATTLGALSPGGTVTLPPRVRLTQNGIATITLTAGLEVGIAEVSAGAGEVSDTAEVAFVPLGPHTIEAQASPTSIPADGQSTAAISATVTDAYGHLVVDGTPVTFATTLGAIAPQAATTSNGQVTATLTASLDLGIAEVSAAVGEVSGTVDVPFMPLPPHIINVQAFPTSLPADGQSTAAISATVTDEHGYPVANGTPVTFTATLGSVTPLASTTVDGLVTATFTAGQAPGHASVTATAGRVQARAWIDLYTQIYLPLVLRH